MGREARAYGIDVILTPASTSCATRSAAATSNTTPKIRCSRGTWRGGDRRDQSQGVGTSLKHFVANNQQTGKKVNDARMTQRALREIYLRAFEYCVRKAKPWSVMGSYNRSAGEYTQTNRELMIDLLRDEWGFRRAGAHRLDRAAPHGGAARSPQRADHARR